MMENNTAPRKKMSIQNEEVSKKEKVEVWTLQEREISKTRYGCEILHENCDVKDSKNPQLPLDAYLVSYVLDGKLCYDITRCSKKTNLFDMYWDKFREDLKEFKWTDGRVNPKVWGYEAPKTKKRK